MISSKRNNRGLIKIVIIVFIALLVLAYFRLNVRDIMASPTFQENWNVVKGLILYVWDHFLKQAVNFAWNVVAEPLIRNGVDKVKEGVLPIRDATTTVLIH